MKKNYLFIFSSTVNSANVYTDLVILVTAKVNETEEDVVNKVAEKYFNAAQYENLLKEELGLRYLRESSYGNTKRRLLETRMRDRLQEVKSFIRTKLKTALVEEGQIITHCRYKDKTISTGYDMISGFSHLPESEELKILKQIH